MADRPTINSRTFRTEFIRLTEQTVVTAVGRPIGVWTPVNVGVDISGYLAVDGFVHPDDTRLRERLDLPAPRPVPETPAAGKVVAGSVEPSPAGDVRTQGRTEALAASSLVTAVGASEGGKVPAGGSTNSSASKRRKSQAARDGILRGVNRGNMP